MTVVERKIPAAFRPEYELLRAQGLTQDAAETLICEAAGLLQDEHQKTIWHLSELAGLLGFRWLVQNAPPKDDLGPR